MSVAPERSVSVDGSFVSVSAPLPALRYALRGLALQPALSFPVRCLLDAAHGPALRADVPRVLPHHECEKLAQEALDGALLEVTGPGTRAPAAPGAGALSREATQRYGEALEESGFSWERSEHGLTLHAATGLPGAGRITVLGCAEGTGVRAAAETTLRLTDPSCLHAMARYALELNHRLRLASVGVDGTGFEVGRIHWQAVLPGALPIERSLCLAVEAVAIARSLSSRIFAALARPEPAAAYLKLRFRHALQSEPLDADGVARLAEARPQAALTETHPHP